MAVTIQYTHVVDRPLNKVFNFLVRDHVKNHPRWDPDMHLEQISPGPLGLGTLIRRRATRAGTTVEGTMEVTEFEPDKSLGMLVKDGSTEMRGRWVFEAIDSDHTRVSLTLELPGADESMDKRPLVMGLERSAQNQRRLMEAEL